MINDQQKDIIIRELAPFHPNSIGIFGSYARNENNKESDIDILVSFGSDITLFDIIGIEMELADKLGIKVDLVTERSLSKKIAQMVHQYTKFIYKT
jgi:predicted nucleotidyltransferase